MKILSAEYNLDSPTIVAYASVVRIYNGDSSNILVTRKASGGTVIGSFMVPAGKVVYVEKDYTDTLDANANVKASKTAFSPMMSFALMSSADPVPTYTHSVSATDVDEGNSFTTTISTTNVDDGTNLYWELSGSGITSGDFSSGALTGTASISSNSATFSHTVDEDSTTEGTETITIKVYSDSGRTEQVGNTLSVNIADTSTTPILGEWSSVFDGSNYLLAPCTTGNLNSGDYTYECWIYPTGIGTNQSSSYHAFLSRWQAGNYCFILEIVRSNGNLLLAWGDGTNYQGQQQHSSTFSNDSWYHVALVRNGTSGKVYVGGVEKMSVTIPDASSNNTLPVCIGSQGDDYDHYNFVGRIHDVRMVNGQALYTSNFTPPTTPLTNVSSCKLLCSKDYDPTTTVVNRLAGSPYDGPLTNYGSVTTTSVDPYTYNHYFDGSGDYLSMASSSDWDLSSGDFTLEAWIYRTANLGWSGILGQWEYGNYNANNSWVFESVSTTMSFYYCSNVGALYGVDGPSAMSQNVWHHIAVTRSGNTLNVWIDGVKGADHTMVGTIQTVSRQAFIGGNVAGSGWFQGYMTDLKLTKGQALYTGNFTPSTELTLTSDGSTDSNVKLMCMDQPTPTAYTRAPGTISTAGGTIDPYRATTGP